MRKNLLCYIHSLLFGIGRPTYEFPHPLARVPQSAGYWVSPWFGAFFSFLSYEWTIEQLSMTNLSIPPCSCCLIQLSYIVVDLLIWWGIRGYINDFRKKKLKLAPIAYFSTYHGSISHLPTGYMWSSHLVPKPKGSYVIRCCSF